MREPKKAGRIEGSAAKGNEPQRASGEDRDVGAMDDDPVRSPPSTHGVGGKSARDRATRQGRNGARNHQRKAAQTMVRKMYQVSKTTKMMMKKKQIM